MKKRRGADIDDVDVVHAQHFVECGGAPGDTELVGDSGQTARIDIAKSDHAKLVGMAGISLSDVRAADATPGDGDVPDPSLLHGTGRLPPTPAVQLNYSNYLQMMPGSILMQRS